jgi:hypothetical protein
MKPKHPPGPPMTLGNMRELGVHHLIAYWCDVIRSIALAIALLACSQASAAVYVTVEEWFKASPEQQQAYVAGTLDTLLFSSTSGLAKGTVEHFVHCVLDSHLTPAQLTDDIRKRPPKSVVSMQVVVLVSLTQRCGPPNPQ